MASCITSQWDSYAPQVKLTVTLDTNTSDGDTAVLDWLLQYVPDGGEAANTNGVGRAYTVKIHGSVPSGGNGTYDIDGVKSTDKIASGSVNIAKGTSAQNISFSVSFAFNITWSGTYCGTKSASGSISIPAKTSYTVTYNANGGSGAPAKQTKWHGTDLTISSTKPTRTGYKFQGWATSSSGSVAYAAGASYTANASVTLYAIWEANTYKVSYNANGGSLGSVPASQTKTYGKALTLSSAKPTRTNYTFKGWGTSASATTVAYAAGASYTANAAITLYAIWTLAYAKPRIVMGAVRRCTSDGTASDTGTYASVNFNWGCDKTVTSIKIEWKLSSTSSWTNSVAVSASGTGGTVTKVIGAGALSIEKTYNIRVTVTDSGGSFEDKATILGVKFAFDTLPNNAGIAFGKPAENKEYADFAYKVRMRDNLLMQAGKAIYSRDADDTVSLSLVYLNDSNNTVLGYGGYANQIGATNIYGNSVNFSSRNGVNFTSRNGVFVDGCQIAKNKVLWSGSWWMNESQTATLSEAISEQANGVVLIWCEYTDGAVVNANFNLQFIPKYFVSAFSARGVGTVITSATMNVVATKYVYISDTSIQGYSTNNTGATEVGCGLIRTSQNFVLRAVIGV